MMKIGHLEQLLLLNIKEFVLLLGLLQQLVLCKDWLVWFRE
jgi:hypothetical protein